jgi:hypothetical protein
MRRFLDICEFSPFPPAHGRVLSGARRIAEKRDWRHFLYCAAFFLPPLGRHPAIIAIADICSTKLRGLGCMNQIFAVIRTKGSAWDHRQPMEQRVGWRSHAAFMNGLEAEGFVLLGGPLDGASDVLLVVRAETAEQVRFRLSQDPWGPEMLETTRIAQWSLRLGDVSPWAETQQQRMPLEPPSP